MPEDLPLGQMEFIDAKVINQVFRYKCNICEHQESNIDQRDSYECPVCKRYTTGYKKLNIEVAEPTI